MQKLSEPTSAVASERATAAGVPPYADLDACPDTRPDWLVQSVADGHAFFDALEKKLAVREAETRAQLGAAWAEFSRTFARRSELQAHAEPAASPAPEGQPR